MTRFKHLLVLLVGLVTLATLAPVASAANAPDRPRGNAAAPDAWRYGSVPDSGRRPYTSPAGKIRVASHTDGVRYHGAAPEVIRYKAFMPNPRCSFCKADRL